MPRCYKCGAKQVVKNGKVFGWQRYKCKSCGYQFTKSAPAGKPMHMKLLAHMLYSAGFSMRRIANIMGVTAQSISRWIKKWHTTYTEETETSENFMEVNSKNLLKIMSCRDDDKYIVMRDSLASGANVYVVVKMPRD